ncbi:MAG TPA: hypothetical protein VHW71_07200 [Steroidobacteraceae bacterium]|jgi:hypothetical protein|nr:hypothetical protein [Steroidobacteraceae bacterium]
MIHAVFLLGRAALRKTGSDFDLAFGFVFFSKRSVARSHQLCRSRTGTDFIEELAERQYAAMSKFFEVQHCPIPRYDDVRMRRQSALKNAIAGLVVEDGQLLTRNAEFTQSARDCQGGNEYVGVARTSTLAAREIHRAIAIASGREARPAPRRSMTCSRLGRWPRLLRRGPPVKRWPF